MIKNLLIYETEAQEQGFRFIFGIDEAGRGPLAGPVVAAAVHLKSTAFSCRIDDSKKLSPKARTLALTEIFENAYVGIGFISEVGIDHINILNATFYAMDAAVVQLMKQVMKTHPVVSTQHVKLLIDGSIMRTQLPFKYQTIVDGDCFSLSIACASIVAKCYRDRLMENYDRIYPEYGFKNHKGYGTSDHRAAIRKLGPSAIHRKSFECTL